MNTKKQLSAPFCGLSGLREIEHRGYYISIGLCGPGTISVQVCGDEMAFDTVDQAKAFIDQMIRKTRPSATCRLSAADKAAATIINGNAFNNIAPDRVYDAVRLAKRLSAFSREWNTWDYRDAVDAAGGVPAFLKDNAVCILSADGSITEWLEDCIDEYDQDEIVKDDCYTPMMNRASRLLRDLRRFYEN